MRETKLVLIIAFVINNILLNKNHFKLIIQFNTTLVLFLLVLTVILIYDLIFFILNLQDVAEYYV